MIFSSFHQRLDDYAMDRSSSAVIMEDLATAIPPFDNILQCCPGVMALTRFIIIKADVASYENGV